MSLDELTRQLLAKHGEQIRQRETELRRLGHSPEQLRKRAVMELLGNGFSVQCKGHNARCRCGT